MNLGDKCWCGGIFIKGDICIHLERENISIDVDIAMCSNCSIYDINTINEDDVKKAIQEEKIKEENRLKEIAIKHEDNKRHLIDSGVLLPDEFKDDLDGFIFSIQDHDIQEITFKVTEKSRRIGIAYSYDASYADLDDYQLTQLRDRIDSWLKRDIP
jgi:phage FluMu gp28-like protein